MSNPVTACISQKDRTQQPVRPVAPTLDDRAVQAAQKIFIELFRRSNERSLLDTDSATVEKANEVKGNTDTIIIDLVFKLFNRKNKKTNIAELAIISALEKTGIATQNPELYGLIEQKKNAEIDYEKGNEYLLSIYSSCINVGLITKERNKEIKTDHLIESLDSLITASENIEPLEYDQLITKTMLCFDHIDNIQDIGDVTKKELFEFVKTHLSIFCKSTSPLYAMNQFTNIISYMRDQVLRANTKNKDELCKKIAKKITSNISTETVKVKLNDGSTTQKITVTINELELINNINNLIKKHEISNTAGPMSKAKLWLASKLKKTEATTPTDSDIVPPQRNDSTNQLSAYIKRECDKLPSENDDAKKRIAWGVLKKVFKISEKNIDQIIERAKSPEYENLDSESIEHVNDLIKILKPNFISIENERQKK